MSEAPIRHSIDQRLGWRCLLPRNAGPLVAVLGFNEAETRLLMDGHPMDRGEELRKGRGFVVVNVDSLPLVDDELERYIRDVEAVVAVGLRANFGGLREFLRRFADVRDYGLLPRQHPRVVIPLCRGRWTRTALELHRPGRATARLGVAIARFLARFGIAGLLFRYRLRISRREPRGDGDSDFALYLGTADDNRKTIVLTLGAKAPRYISKIGRTTTARASLAREAEVLKLLGRTSLSDRIPRIVNYKEGPEEFELQMEYRRRRVAHETQIRNALSTFLAEMMALETSEMPLAVWLTHESFKSLHRRVPGLEECFRRLAEGGVKLYFQRIHGDLAPWNCSWTDSGIFVFDWEASRPRALAFSDAFYYVLAPELLVRRARASRKLFTEAVNLAKDVAMKASFPVDSVLVHFIVWLMQENSVRCDSTLDDLLDEAVAVLGQPYSRAPNKEWLLHA